MDDIEAEVLLLADAIMERVNALGREREVPAATMLAAMIHSVRWATNTIVASTGEDGWRQTTADAMHRAADAMLHDGSAGTMQ